MGKVFIYWDNSNTFIGAKDVAAIKEGELARGRVRIHFKSLLRLAHAERDMEKAVVAGSVPPGAQQLWDSLRKHGVEVEELFDRGDGGKEQEVPDMQLQLRMMTDLVSQPPGIAVLLTGDGKGREEKRGFHHTLELMHARGWRVELLAWEQACKPQMRDWVRKNGVYVPLDDHYESVTSLKASRYTPEREAKQVDLTRRPTLPQ